MDHHYPVALHTSMFLLHDIIDTVHYVLGLSWFKHTDIHTEFTWLHFPPGNRGDEGREGQKMISGQTGDLNLECLNLIPGQDLIHTLVAELAWLSFGRAPLIHNITPGWEPEAGLKTREKNLLTVPRRPALSIPTNPFISTIMFRFFPVEERSYYWTRPPTQFIGNFNNSGSHICLIPLVMSSYLFPSTACTSCLGFSAFGAVNQTVMCV